MSNEVEQLAEGRLHFTLWRLLLCMFFIGGALAVWQLPWGRDLEATLCLLFLTATTIGAAFGALFGMSLKGAAVGASIGVVTLLLFVIPYLAFIFGGP